MARNNITESGNAFVIIMIAVVLFAALMFTFSRSAQQGGENLSDRQQALDAADMTGYAQTIERATARVMLTGISETQLSLVHGTDTTYQNTNDCGADSCRVFLPDGGAATWQSPPPGANDGSDWVIAGTNAAPGVGNDANADLILFLQNVKQNLCTKIDQSLNINPPDFDPPQTTGSIDFTPFTGTFANTGRLTTTPVLTGVDTACIRSGGSYVFYSVVMER